MRGAERGQDALGLGTDGAADQRVPRLEEPRDVVRVR